MMALAARRSQIRITTHSVPLAEALERLTGARPVRLEKVDGETLRVGARLDELDESPDEEDQSWA